jgi:glycopeptide antibiotics resistance protein
VNRAWALFGAYLIVLVTLTFFPFDGFHGTDPVDLRLQAFRTIHFALKKGLGSREFTVLIGNLVAFVPLGLLLPQMIGRRSVALVLLAALALSVAIEAGQLAVSMALGFAYRTADIDDVIVNVTGAALGYLIYVLVTVIWTRAESARSGSG